jgi:hypothetical protein
VSDIDLGAAYPIAFDVRDAANALANATGVTLTITLPDGTTATPTVTNPPAVTGQYRLTYLPATAGRYSWAAVTTTPNAAYGDVFNVRTYASLISLAEAKTHLNKTSTTDDDEFRGFLIAATELIESKVGACVRRAFTERVYDTEGQPGLLLSHRPLLSVTSVTATVTGGQVWATADLAPDTAAGIVCLPDGAGFWGGPWDVVYQAGRAVIPERFLQACEEQVRFLWDTQRGAAAPSVLQGEEIFTPSVGAPFTIPRRVLGLLEADMVPAI